MDFSTIEIEAPKKKAAKATAVKFTPVDGDKKPLIKIGGAALTLDLLPMTSPEGARELQKWRLKFGADTGEAHLEADEAELDRLVDLENEKGAELAARVVCGWNIKNKAGEDVPCTLESRKAVFENEDFAAVAVAVMQEVTRITTELGN